MNIDEILEKLADDGAPDPDDVPNLSPNQRQVLRAQAVARVRLKTNIRTTAALVAERTAQISDLQQKLATLTAADAQLVKALEAAPDHRTIADRREGMSEWQRQEGLKAGRRALRGDVEYFGGVPSVPHCLKQILGVTIDREGRELPTWYGPIGTLEARIENLTRERHEAERLLTGYVRAAEELIAASQAETVST